MKSVILAMSVLLLNFSCSTKNFILSNSEIVSFYFDKKIKNLEKKKVHNIEEWRALIKIKVEYAYGILMEKGDRLFEDDYSKSSTYYDKANKLFLEAKQSSFMLLSERYSNFDHWIKKDSIILFKKNDIHDLYWYAASLAGVIQSGRGSDPHELVNIPIIGMLLNTAIEIDPNWEDGKLYSAMMSYTAVRPDLYGQALEDSVNFYYKKALQLSDSSDVSIFVSYAELIHKPKQQKKEFIDKLNYVIQTELANNRKNEINNLLSKRRAKWLLSKVDDYFL